jgi:hypothetical protein
VSLTISTGQPAASGHAVVRVYGWDHNEDCKSRARIQKLRSPEDVALLGTIVRANLGRTNIEIQVLYQRAVAAPFMVQSNRSFEEVLSGWTDHPETAPRAADICSSVR